MIRVELSFDGGASWHQAHIAEREPGVSNGCLYCFNLACYACSSNQTLPDHGQAYTWVEIACDFPSNPACLRLRPTRSARRWTTTGAGCCGAARCAHAPPACRFTGRPSLIALKRCAHADTQWRAACASTGAAGTAGGDGGGAGAGVGRHDEHSARAVRGGLQGGRD